MVDDGTGVFPVYHEPRLTGNNPERDVPGGRQDNDAWAVFGDVTFEITDQFELDVAVRYDEDKRENTTETPPAFLPDPSAFTGEVRSATCSETQPKVTLRYKPTEDITFYGGWSRGFRSGGFNQTGVGAVADASGIAGVNDVFQAEVADTWEVGFKGQFLDRRLNVGLSLFDTESTNGYFFVFLAANSTQNLGNLDADYKGAEFEISGTRHRQLRAVRQLRIHGQRDHRHGRPVGDRQRGAAGLRCTLTTWARSGVSRWATSSRWRCAPTTSTSAGPGGSRTMRPRAIRSTWSTCASGSEGEKWAVTAWSKNLTDEEYNAEFSPGGFLFRALPLRYGVEFSYKF